MHVPEFFDMLKYLQARNFTAVLVGDFNYDLLTLS